MATHHFSILHTRLDFADKSLLHQFVCKTMFGFPASFWVFVSTCFCCVFGSIFRYLIRSRCDGSSGKMDLKQRQIGESFFQESGTASTASTSKCQFMCGRDFSGFIEEPQTLSFSVREFYAGSNDGCISNCTDLDTYRDAPKVYDTKREDAAEDFSGEFSLEAEDIDHTRAEDSAECLGGGKDSEEEDIVHSESGDSTECTATQFNLEESDVDNSKTEDPPGSLSDEEDALEEQKQKVFAQDDPSERGETIVADDNILADYQFPVDSNQDLIDSGDRLIISGDVFNPVNDEAFLIEDVGEWLELETLAPIATEKAEDAHEDPAKEEVKDIEYEYWELVSNLQSSNDEELSSEKDSRKVEHRQEQDMDLETTNEVSSLRKSDEPSSQKSPSSSDSDNDDDDSRWENLWEHGNLIEQLKFELKNVKTRGLPTILEESESPKIVDDLKPLKIEEKLEHKDRIEELQKLYKRYADKMRKLDILNYQTVHAIGFLRLKDPVQLNSNKKSSAPGIKSLLSQKMSKLRRLQDGPTLKLIRELKSDLEMVYVGQLCLSWEILQWQYGKAQELQEYDPHGFRLYTQAINEFHQFGVLVQRFIENEPFQGPRVQCYVKNRCLVHTFLQVPAIRDDSFKDKKERTETGQNGITSAMLTEAIEKSMHVFWDFLRVDKDEKSRVDLQNPADIDLLMDVQTELQKKEKRLKELLRSKNCIVKRLQKHREDRLDRAVFLAQVELKLVARALSMSRLTRDQLEWCHKKLSQINIVNRKIHVEPSFLLFP